MPKKSASWDMLLLLTAVIWGFAFVAQRVGMDHMGPFTFNGIRFAMGAVSLLPFIFWLSRRKKQEDVPVPSGKLLFAGGMFAGVLVFLGAGFQQLGIVYTTAGKAGFITGLYMVLVPVLGLAVKQRTTWATGLGIVLAVIGLFLLSATEDLTIAWGDILVLIGAFFWAAQVLVIGYFSPKLDSLKLAFVEFMVCAMISMFVAILTEEITLEGINGGMVPLLYGGLVSVGIAYTIQVFAQKRTHPSHAGVIMGMEAVFAVIGGWLFLAEVLTLKGFLGCCLMLAGMLVSQIWGQTRKQRRRRQRVIPT